MIRGATALAAVAVVAAASRVASAGPSAPSSSAPAEAAAPLVERSTVEVGPAGAPISLVSIDNPIGDVRVEGHDGVGLKVVAIKRAPDALTLGRLRVSLVPDPSGAMRIVTAVDRRPEAPLVTRDRVRIDLVVYAPREARVDARTVDGQLELVDMDAGGELDAGTGGITVRNVSGPIVARVIDAPVSISTVFGAVDATALTGDLDFTAVRGDRLSASVHRGRIDARDVRSREIDLVATIGDVRVVGDAVPGGTIRVATVTGSIAMQLRGAVRVRARAPRVELPSSRAEDGWEVARVGDGDHAATVELSAREGAILFMLGSAY
ncbi:MAG: hypothetical protein R2939_12225 [Kofleriaceae bacterium]